MVASRAISLDTARIAYGCCATGCVILNKGMVSNQDQRLSIGESRPTNVPVTAHHLGAASYGPSGDLVFNKPRLGSDWFERGITNDVVQLLIHEFGHEYSPDHLSSEYHEALCHIGARLFAFAKTGGS